VEEVESVKIAIKLDTSLGGTSPYPTRESEWEIELQIIEAISLDSRESKEQIEKLTEKSETIQEELATGPVAHLSPGKMNQFGEFTLKSSLDLE